MTPATADYIIGSAASDAAPKFASVPSTWYPTQLRNESHLAPTGSTDLPFLCISTQVSSYYSLLDLCLRYRIEVCFLSYIRHLPSLSGTNSVWHQQTQPTSYSPHQLSRHTTSATIFLPDSRLSTCSVALSGRSHGSKSLQKDGTWHRARAKGGFWCHLYTAGLTADC